MCIFPEFLHWKGYSANGSSNMTQYRQGQNHDLHCKGNCRGTFVDNDLSNYRQFDALTTLPRKNRSTQKESFNKIPHNKGELKLKSLY